MQRLLSAVEPAVQHGIRELQEGASVLHAMREVALMSALIGSGTSASTAIGQVEQVEDALLGRAGGEAWEYGAGAGMGMGMGMGMPMMPYGQAMMPAMPYGQAMMPMQPYGMGMGKGAAMPYGKGVGAMPYGKGAAPMMTTMPPGWR